jgi:hypothetical protein
MVAVPGLLQESVPLFTEATDELDELHFNRYVAVSGRTEAFTKYRDPVTLAYSPLVVSGDMVLPLRSVNVRVMLSAAIGVVLSELGLPPFLAKAVPKLKQRTSASTVATSIL